MPYDQSKVWKSDTTQQFAKVMVAIKSTNDMQNFIRDVMTEKEIIEISSRLEAARMLVDGKKYIEIVAKTKLSSRTIARISDWLQNGCSGYQTALKTINQHHSHIPPVRAV